MNDVTIHYTDKKGYPITAPFKVYRAPSSVRWFRIYGRVQGTSAIVIARAVSVDFKRKRDAVQFIKDFMQ